MCFNLIVLIFTRMLSRMVALFWQSFHGFWFRFVSTIFNDGAYLIRLHNMFAGSWFQYRAWLSDTVCALCARIRMYEHFVYCVIKKCLSSFNFLFFILRKFFFNICQNFLLQGSSCFVDITCSPIKYYCVKGFAIKCHINFIVFYSTITSSASECTCYINSDVTLNKGNTLRLVRVRVVCVCGGGGVSVIPCEVGVLTFGFLVYHYSA